MAPSSSSSSSPPKPPGVVKGGAGTKDGPSNRSLHVGGERNDARSEHGGEAIRRSPSGVSLSRPRSLLAPSRPSPSTPLMNAATPSSVLSTSPSTRSIVDRSNAGSGVHSGLRAGESSAMGRLRRVASNASIASSIVPRMRGSKPEQDEQVAIEERKESRASEGKESESPSGKENGGIAPEIAGADEGKPVESIASANKRHLDPTSGNEGSAKQARRKTWFGFMAANDEDESGDPAQSSSTQPSVASVAKNAEAEDVEMHESNSDARDADGQGTIKGKKYTDDQGTVKSWLPWRAPGLTNEGDNDLSGFSAEAPASYTDSVRRYLSWGTQAASSAASPSTGWGWPAWRSASTPTQQGPPASSGGEGGDVARMIPTSSSDAAHEDGNALVSNASTSKPDNGSFAQHEPASNSSAAPDSFIYRWMPTWGRSVQQDTNKNEQGPKEDSADGDPSTHHDQPTTPAEQYKAEALAHLGSKDAILNNATRSTWINYFSSRSAFQQPKVNNEDLDEPEIMRIDTDSGTSGPQKAMHQKSASMLTAPFRSGTSTPADSQSVSKVDVAQKDEKRKSEGLKAPAADPAPPKSRPATPLTKDKETAQQVIAAAGSSQQERRKTGGKTGKPPVPNLIIPSFEDTFSSPPRSIPVKVGVWEKTMSLFFNNKSSQAIQNSNLPSSSFSRAPKSIADGRPGEAQSRLPRAWGTMGEKEKTNARGCKGIRKVTVIGIHGWFSQGPIRNLFGEPTGTSTRFATLMTEAVQKQFHEAGYTLSDEQITVIPLLGDGLVSDRVDKSFSALLGNAKWMKDLLTSDAIFVAAHSQGSIVASHLLARLVEQRHLNPLRTRVVLLCMCGIHNGPFAHLRGSISSYYMSTFETPAARELFEFQNGHSPVSRLYAASLRIVCAAGIKLVYVASLDDQVVPLFSALHTSASHPSILRAIFCDGAAFPRVDFLTNLLSFCVNVRNAGLWDHHLVTLLSSSVAGSLYGGLGHSLVYDEPQVYSLAVRYLLEVTSPATYPTARPGQENGLQSKEGVQASVAASLPAGVPLLDLDDEYTLARNQKWNSNPYALPWSLRGLLEDEQVRHYFSKQIEKLIHDYLEWQPQTKTLKDVQFRLEPMRLIAAAPQRADTSSSSTSSAATAKANQPPPSNSKL